MSIEHSILPLSPYSISCALSPRCKISYTVLGVHGAACYRVIL